MTRIRAILDCSSLGVWVTVTSPDVAVHLWAPAIYVYLGKKVDARQTAQDVTNGGTRSSRCDPRR
jgi:hypothetical protein